MLADGKCLQRLLTGRLPQLTAKLAITLQQPAGEQLTTGAAPYPLVVAKGVDETAAKAGLASLGGSLAENPADEGQGPAPAFGQDEVDGVQTNSFRVSPTVQLTYAVFDGLAAAATDPAGVAELIQGDGGLADDDLYERATDGFGDDVSLQAFLDLEGLVNVGEQAGLAEDPVYATFAGDFRRLDALGVAVSDDGDVLATDARLLIGDSGGSEPSSD